MKDSLFQSHQASNPEATPDNLFAARLRGFGPIGILAIVIILAGNFILAPLSAFLALAWVQLSRTPWRDIGYLRPKSWSGSLMIGLGFGVTFKVLMKVLVMPLLGASALNPVYHYLAGNTAALPGMIIMLIVVAGFGEETLFRGYLFERFGKLLGSSLWARAFTVLVTSVWFGLLHYPDQGLAGAEQATITGLVFGIIFAYTGRLFMLMVAHAAFDLTAVAIIYLDVESQFAHLFVR